MNISLNEANWMLRGWNKNQWTYLRTMETGSVTIPAIPAIPAAVPGGVHADLMKAGYIQDFHYGVKTMEMEWVENREWSYETTFDMPQGDEEGSYHKYILCFDGLDYSGCVLLNKERILDFEGTHLAWQVDITDRLQPKDNALKVVFFTPPDVDGQTGYTSKLKTLKPRFNYLWDWCPRVVNVGIWQDVYLHCYKNGGILDFYPRTSVEEDAGMQSGRLDVSLEMDICIPGDYQMEVIVSKDGEKVAQEMFAASFGSVRKATMTGTMVIPDPALWWPNNMGDQPLYDVSVRVLKEGEVCDAACKRVGFRKMEYRRNPGAPEESLPYTIVVNGKPLFIQGINWVPLSPLYGTVTEADYRKALTSFKAMNINLVRIWGGAILEKEAFFRVCDELGILVWQEFPQSSSGLDNTPCEEADFIEELCRVAEHDIRLRRHHPSMAVWCGGNELMWHNYVPVDLRSHNIYALYQVVQAHHPECLFLPASASGYAFNFNPAFVGQGKNWDVHGPWDYQGAEQHYRHYNMDDSLICTETGCPAPARLENLVKYSEGVPLWPPDESNRFWTHRGSWWIRRGQMEDLFGDFQEDIALFVKAYRYVQAEGLAYAVEATRRRAPRTSGMIIWMGNEPFPNACNTSLLEFDGAAKPAYYRVQDAFSPLHPSARYDKIACKSGETFEAALFLSSDKPVKHVRLTYTVRDLYGRTIQAGTKEDMSDMDTLPVSFVPEQYAGGVVFLDLLAEDEWNRMGKASYIFTVDGEKPMAPLIHLPEATIRLTKTEKGCRLENTGDIAAAGIYVLAKDADGVVMNLSPNYVTLFPHTVCEMTVMGGGEAAVIQAEALNMQDIILETKQV